MENYHPTYIHTYIYITIYIYIVSFHSPYKHRITFFNHVNHSDISSHIITIKYHSGMCHGQEMVIIWFKVVDPHEGKVKGILPMAVQIPMKMD